MSAARTLQEWLDWQQSLHPRAIDLGLERVRAVAACMGVLGPPATVITVAGTNGKGSCVAFLEAILSAAGYRVGAYTSPHLLRYNERVRINGQEAGDSDLIEAFERVERVRGDTSLSYFEFGTLAAFDLFQRAACDVWVLEVGLGGRLDAVNVLDADLALISSIGLDHTDWLGDDLEQIGAEKAGVFRSGKPAVFAQSECPRSVLAYAAQLNAPLQRAGRDYSWRLEEDGRWSVKGAGWAYAELPAPALLGPHQLANAAGVVAGLAALSRRLPVTPAALRTGLREASIAGRFQIVAGEVEWVLDVAHNRESAELLAQGLRQRPCGGRTFAVFAQMQRKELAAVLAELKGVAAVWYLMQLPDADARASGQVAAELRRQGCCVAAEGPPQELLAQIDAVAQAGDRVVAFGSFRTVEEVLRARLGA